MAEMSPTRNNRQITFWLLVILGLIALNIDVWAWKSDARWFGLIPVWIVYSIGLQGLLASSLYRLGKVFRA